MSLLHIGGSAGTSVVSAEGVDFDGVADYLSRNTSLVGVVSSNVAVFSFWVYIDKSFTNGCVYQSSTSANQNDYISITIENGNNLMLRGHYPGGDYVYRGISNAIPKETWTHIYLSLNYTSPNTAKDCYINKVYRSFDLTGVDESGAYFINSSHNYYNVKRNYSINADGKMRLSNFFLSSNYYPLATFITADGKPTPTATLKALNPILYLPMKDAATAHINEGTGGNFTLNGTIATSARGANQDNCVASILTYKYLSRSSQLVSNPGSTKQITFSFNINSKNTTTTTYDVFDTYGSYLNISVYVAVSCPITVRGKNSAGKEIFRFYIGYGVVYAGVNLSIQISFDLSNISKRHAFINGQSVGSWEVYTNDYIYLYPSTSPYYTIFGSHTTAANLIGNCGEFYFDTKYIDLATNNPFWDSVENKPVPVRKVIANTGVTPLIAMPIDASNPGKNYGTGGDFTANSAPYVGARGASEFWARSAKFDGSTSSGSLVNTSIKSAIDSKTYSTVLCLKSDVTSQQTLLGIYGANAPTGRAIIRGYSAAGQIQILAYSQSGANILNAYTTDPVVAINNWILIFICIDLTDSSKCKFYLGNTNKSLTIGTIVNQYIGFSTSEIISLGSAYDGVHPFLFSDGDIGLFYFTTDYIDFSQEANRLKFVDGLGYPLDLKKQIDAGVIPKPLIYLPFDDPTNLGKNLGTGGNFTVNGTVTQGADVNG